MIAADGSFSFQLGNDVLQNEMLYSLSIDCTPKPTGSCPLQVPLHALISGERLKQGKFTINILTEVIHQRLGYYIAVGFNAVDLKQEMDAIATMLLDKGQNQNDEADYEDILNWAPLNPNSATAKRSSAISEISERLSEHGYAEKLQLDIQKLFSPIAETISTPNPAIQPAIQTVTDGSLLYVLNGSTLTAFDISKPLLPTFAGGIDVPGTLDMKLSGSYIYASYRTQEVGGEFGLKIIDVSDPANIYLRKNFPLESPAYGIYVSGSLAYVVNKPLDAQKPSQLLSIDISNPDHPSVEKSIKLGNFDGQIDACDVTIHNGLAYLTNRSAQLLHVVDLSSETAQPQNAVATSPMPCDIAAQGKYAYIATEYTGVEIFDLSNAGKPNSVKNILTQSLSSRIALSDSDIYIASAESGLQVFDISIPTDPHLKRIFDTPGYARDVAITQHFAFVADDKKGTQVIDLSERNPPPLLVGAVATGGSFDVITDNNLAYTLGIWPLLNVIDVSAPSDPVSIFQISDNPNPESLTLIRQHLLIAIGNTIHIYKIDGASNGKPEFVSEVPANEWAEIGSANGWASGITARDNTAFIAAGLAGLQIMDITDLEKPKLGVLLDTSDIAYEVVLKDQYAYVADGGGGLKIVNIEHPDRPDLAGSINTPGIARNIAIDGNVAYIADSEEGLFIVDIKNPNSPTFIGRVDTPGDARDVVIADNIAYIADDYAGVQAIDVRDPFHPHFIGAARTTVGAQGIASIENHIFVTTRYGLEILRAIPQE